MNKDIIEHPQLDQPYLVRKHRGGDPRSRYQPAAIIKGRDETGYITVLWYYTQQEETLQYFDGCVKVLTKRWLNHELPQAELALQVAIARQASVQRLLSDASLW